MTGTLVSTIETGKRYLQILGNGTTRISLKPGTENPAELDPESTWIIGQHDGDTVHAGPAVAAEVVNIPDGSVIEMFTDEELFYQAAQARAVPWELGLTVKKHCLLSHADKIYIVVQPHTIVDPNHTPDIVLSLYSEIQAPGPSGYPEWVQKYAPPYYQVGDRVTYNGQNWECTAADGNGNNVWAPGVFGWTVID